ncbi:hypothetical protein LTR62_007596 [Meristemomyces frigidus]|uniref:Uncharacterized protein n=1 Tax=Meristemomyces frigidus TaxID=1508187 RepID=A0AAN7YNW8_9PEZI|nr:hypothetical protein LTR62_007596 [Meristemomyces frigidus]
MLAATPVFRGLKSWASKLHQQLPLSQKESQRLLTALTTSFRQHLDEVHPQSETEKPKSKPLIVQPRSNGGPFHSSAIFADQHLASILTNPLLSKTASKVSKEDQNYANAQIELQKITNRDPIALLGEYHQRGSATIAIGRLCLTKFNESIAGLSVAKQKRLVAATQPAKRALLWLWKGKFYETAEFAEDHVMIDLLVSGLMREGLEQYLWKWLQVDQSTCDHSRSNSTGARVSADQTNRMLYLYRWKGRVLRAMANAVLQGAYGEKGTLNAALTVYFKALALLEQGKDAVGSRSHMSCLPLHPLGIFLHGRLTRHRGSADVVDVELFERFRASTNAWSKDRSLDGDFNLAILDLYHPVTPDARPVAAAFRRILALKADKTGKSEANKSSLPESTGLADATINLEVIRVKHLSLALFVLKQQAHHEEANWLRQALLQRYPERASSVDRLLREHAIRRAAASGLTSRTEQNESSSKASFRVPIPAFT